MRSMIEAAWRKALAEAYLIAPTPSSQRGFSAAFRSFVGNEPVLHLICESSGRPRDLLRPSFRSARHRPSKW